MELSPEDRSSEMLLPLSSPYPKLWVSGQNSDGRIPSGHSMRGANSSRLFSLGNGSPATNLDRGGSRTKRKHNKHGSTLIPGILIGLAIGGIIWLCSPWSLSTQGVRSGDSAHGNIPIFTGLRLLPRANDILDAATPFSPDPYLSYRPSFAYSLPVQILIQGITLTLLSVLLIHILFTAQYHFPLSRFNYVLQLCGILLVLGSIMGSIVVVMSAQVRASASWPYMLDYISVNTPPSAWSLQQKGAWYFLQCLCNGLVHLTHIQFLTLLFPSATEVKLIFLLLGPLALAASGLTFTSLSDRRTTIDLGDAIRNIFDGTLLLIFSVSLLIWGLLVNRKRAWRLDGGTAAFGAGATVLAILSTAINFVEVKEDTINWLQNLLWAIVLWQSWLGFWWWVGSGMGVGEVEDMVHKEEKRRLRAHRRKERHQTRGPTFSEGEDQPVGASTAIEAPDRLQPKPSTETGETGEVAEEIEMRETTGSGRRRRGQQTVTGSSSSSDASPLPLESVSGIFAYPINLILRYARHLRSGHEEATKRKVLRRANLRRQVFERQNGTAAEGWGLGSFGIREAEDSERRLSEANRMAQEGHSISDDEILSPSSDIERDAPTQGPSNPTSGIRFGNQPRPSVRAVDPVARAIEPSASRGLKGWVQDRRLKDRSQF